MPFIQKETFPISFQSGVESKTDALQLQPPALLALKNARFDKIGALNKRPGYNVLNNSVMSDGLITSAVAIDAFKDELNLFDNKNIYTYITANDSWASRGPAISLINTNQQIVRTASAQQLNPDSVSFNGISVYAYEDSRDGCRYDVVDEDTGSYAIASKLLLGSLSKPKTIIFNDLAYIFYAASNNMYFRTINSNNPNVISSQTNLFADGVFNSDVEYKYDVQSHDGYAWLAYFADLGPTRELRLFSLDTSNNMSSYTIVASGIDAVTDAVPTPNICVSVVIDSLEQLWVSWSNGIEVRSSCYDISSGVPSVILSNMVIETVDCPTITGLEYINAGQLELVYEIVGTSGPATQRTKAVLLDNLGNIIPIGNIRSVGIGSKPFRYQDNIYIHLTHQSTLQSTYFMVLLTNVPFTIVSKVAAGVGGGLRTNGELPEVTSPTAGKFLWANLIKGSFISEGNTTFSLLGVNATVSDFTNINKFNSTTFADNLLFVGGILQSYDGVSVAEQNFHIYPEGVQTLFVAGGGALSVGQYQYQVVYAWADNGGRIQYSSPSPTVTVECPLVGHVFLTIPTLRLSAKTGVTIKIYRTDANGSVFREVTSELAPLLNNPLVDSINFTDIAADADIQANQLIYTFGGVVPNAAPPSCSMIVSYNDRVMLSGLEDPNLIWFSKNRVNNTNFNTVPVEFSQYLTIAVNPFGGRITALSFMDGNLIIFKENCIFIMNGDGPNDTGKGGSFSNPQIITQSVGCSNPNSIIFMGQGVMFQSPNKGIFLLPRSLEEPKYIGSGVDTESKEHLVSSATLDPKSNSVVFTTFDGPALVYDYLVGQWATWTNHNAVDSIVFNGEFTFAKSNGRIYTQDQGIFYDGTIDGYQQFYAMDVITPWISASKVLGYQSVFKFFILGQYKGAHSLEVEIGFDFNPAFTEQTTIPVTSIIGINVWGSDQYWGESTPWGGAWNPYIFQVNMPIQKCTSFRIRLKDTQVIPYNEGLTLNSLLIEIGGINNGVRMPVRNRFGATNGSR